MSGSGCVQARLNFNGNSQPKSKSALPWRLRSKDTRLNAPHGDTLPRGPRHTVKSKGASHTGLGHRHLGSGGQHAGAPERVPLPPQHGPWLTSCSFVVLWPRTRSLPRTEPEPQPPRACRPAARPGRTRPSGLRLPPAAEPLLSGF